MRVCTDGVARAQSLLSGAHVRGVHGQHTPAHGSVDGLRRGTRGIPAGSACVQGEEKGKNERMSRSVIGLRFV